MRDRLEGLLQKQLELVHRGRLAAAGAICDQTGPCVQGIVSARVPHVPGSDQQWQRIEQLYGELSLALTAQRGEVSAALNAIRQSRRLLHTYGTHGQRSFVDNRGKNHQSSMVDSKGG
jgi:hypothetical protein